MFSGQQLRSIALTAKARYPMIKFRYGPGRDKTSAAASHSASSGKGQAGSGEVIYDFQLPQRYRRRPIDEKEIEAINSGGA